MYGLAFHRTSESQNSEKLWSIRVRTILPPSSFPCSLDSTDLLDGMSCAVFQLNVLTASSGFEIICTSRNTFKSHKFCNIRI